MKKSVLFLLLTLLAIPFFAKSYRIKDYHFEIEGAGFKFLGATKDYSILKNYPIPKNKTFSDSDELSKFIENYKTKLESSRAFEQIYISYIEDPSSESDSEITDIYLNFVLKDSNHLIVMPYPNYSSTNGLTLALKAKDTNFLGSMNPLNADIKLRFRDGAITPIFSFSFDYPFKAGIFDIVFLNEYGISYTVSDLLSGLEWNTKTGINVSLPYKKFNFNVGFIQLTNGNLNMKVYDDYSYFTENAYISVPITITEFPNYSALIYAPSITYNWNWDFNGINIENDALAGPELIFSHTLSNASITWKDNFRKGYSLSLTNSFTYNFQRNDFIPFVSFEGKFYWNYKANDQEYWNRFGICSDFYAFTYLDLPQNHYKYGYAIGARLRGIKDTEPFLGNVKPISTASSAIMFSIDLPHNIFTTNFSKQILNFNMQFAPFFDMALVYNRDTKRYFHPYDGYYCTGLEVLVYPLKWSSITVRASLGFDLKQAVQCNNFLEGISKYKELFIGIGLQY